MSHLYLAFNNGKGTNNLTRVLVVRCADCSTVNRVNFHALALLHQFVYLHRAPGQFGTVAPLTAGGRTDMSRGPLPCPTQNTETLEPEAENHTAERVRSYGRFFKYGHLLTFRK